VLIKRPKILIFDEATSALDAQSEYLVQSSIDELVQNEKSITIIVIAHRLSTIVNCNRIIVFESGEVLEQGKHHELMELNGVYKHLVERQIHGIITDDDL
jgi:ABC-type multidrug transport system fused ATPase/permease subunit